MERLDCQLLRHMILTRLAIGKTTTKMKGRRILIAGNKMWCPSNFVAGSLAIFCVVLVISGICIYFVEERSGYNIRAICYNNTCYFSDESKASSIACRNVSDCLNKPVLLGEKYMCKTNLDCQNGGVCVDSKCKCKWYFAGQRCQYMLPCSALCENGGSCKYKRGRVTCKCPPGCYGRSCEWGPNSKVQMNGTWMVHYVPQTRNESKSCLHIVWNSNSLQWLYVRDGPGNSSDWTRQNMTLEYHNNHTLLLDEGTTWDLRTNVFHSKEQTPIVMLTLDSPNGKEHFVLTQSRVWKDDCVPPELMVLMKLISLKRQNECHRSPPAALF